MNSIHKRRAGVNIAATPTNVSSFGAKQICFIVGLTCLVGFGIDMLSIGLPPNPFDLPWRIGFLQQMGDRSIILLFGAALLIYSQLGNQRWTKPLSLICLSIGVAFMLSSILVIRDSLILKDQALTNIRTQAEQLQTQLETNRNSPDLLPTEITPEQFDQAAQQVNSQAEVLQQNTRNGITKAGLASIGNLVVVGMGLVGLGRFGLMGARRKVRG